MGDFYILSYWLAKSSLILFKCQCIYHIYVCFMLHLERNICRVPYASVFLLHCMFCCFKCFVCFWCICKQMRMPMRNIHIFRLSTNHSIYITHDGYTFIGNTGNTNRTRNTSTYKNHSEHVEKNKLTESTSRATNQIASLGLHKYTSSVMQYCIYHGTCTCILTTQMSDQNGSTSRGVLSLRCFKICSMPHGFDNVPFG